MALKVALLGVGNIAPAYMIGCGKFPNDVEVVACADMVIERAQAFAAQYNLRAYSVADLLAQPDIDIVINLTIPAAHAEVSRQIIAAGKHLYSEKPFALSREDGRALLDAAAAAGLKTGCAPDTFMGAGGQTARSIIDTGLIGQPVAATAFMMGHGPEGWHPNPYFFFQPGAGPVFDMAPYYITAMVNFFGAVTQVSAMAGRAFTERIAEHEAVKGQVIPVNVNTHTTGTLRFESGVLATVVFSFDVWHHDLPPIQVHGTTSSMTVPDPNIFGGSVQVWNEAEKAWQEVAPIGQADVQRGIGVADMARAIRDGGDYRASGELAFHVLDVMIALDEAATTGTTVTLGSRVDRPAAVE